MTNSDYKIIVGLEIHVQMATRTKMFCGCELVFAAEPNSRVCPVCLGLPGALPVMNRQAVEFAILTATALNCKVAEFTKWDRKSYYYPDLPKNYQISQYDLPIGSNGYIEIPVGDGVTKKIRICRVHLEEDAGKNIHTAGSFSQVDLNRAGTPLLEIVTEPDINSAEEVRLLAMELQRIVRFLGVSEADMQKGHMRFEPNVNLHIKKDGSKHETPIAEIKNLNSFKALEKSVGFEVRSQLDNFIERGEVMQSGNKKTFGWDDVKEVTVLQRGKEEAHDYRYFPDPDLVPVVVDEKWLGEIKGGLCELPLKMQGRFVSQYGLSDYDASVLTTDRATSEYFDSAVKAGGDAKRVCNLITQTGLKTANEKGCGVAQLGIEPKRLAELAKMTDASQISATAAVTIFVKMMESKEQPGEIAEKLNLLQKSDAGELEKIVDEVITANPQAVEDAKSGDKKSKKAHGFLMGQIMQKTKGTANPQVVAKILGTKLKA
ncbi:MAG: Asp-tRNA(Asn)/Glu-tRNA(Gln) amidotransferase subunit GatB [Planctomycetes bacterium]|nr:Asp-tRNA(Asn)/Glu-tRNA(Gln) amidotransferase subunit GatB [Planctomycetota bacterium]MBU1518993.1 Asp-tRNA(Asn)/Glu-tRNA(Gln) amidotransferase subunit GatB [Planctomycetota bacterium]MBU2457447.1 Asp-tRNA(Asn)/Glu-tRNA(Gln) amidotransferase subunit GatB [Planctomycetota bacterium]